MCFDNLKKRLYYLFMKFNTIISSYSCKLIFTSIHLVMSSDVHKDDFGFFDKIEDDSYIIFDSKAPQVFELS